MKIENQPSFKSVTLTKTAERAMSKRLASGEFISTCNNFVQQHKNSKLDIIVSTFNEKSDRLIAFIKHNGRQINYMEESKITRFLYTPVHFLEKISEQAKALESILFRNKV